jgi:hypothetical protein
MEKIKIYATQMNSRERGSSTSIQQEKNLTCLGKVLSTWNINFSVLSNFLADPRKFGMLSRTRVISNLAGICQHIQLKI